MDSAATTCEATTRSGKRCSRRGFLRRDAAKPRLWWYERGKTTKAPFWWHRIGPLVIEFHADRFSLGVVASRWFVGVYLGFFVVTFGKRVWVETSRPTTAWLVGTLSMEEARRAR